MMDHLNTYSTFELMSENQNSHNKLEKSLLGTSAVKKASPKIRNSVKKKSFSMKN